MASTARIHDLLSAGRRAGAAAGVGGFYLAARAADSDTIALITAIAAMLVAIGAVTFIVVRPQRPVLRA